jgi:hypothetical protein
MLSTNQIPPTTFGPKVQIDDEDVALSGGTKDPAEPPPAWPSISAQLSAGDSSAAVHNSEVSKLAGDYAPLGQPSIPETPAQGGPSSIQQPIRPSFAATKPDEVSSLSETELNKFVEKANPYPGAEPPKVNPLDIKGSGLKTHSYDNNQSLDKTTQAGMGRIPENKEQQSNHPDFADYTQRRPEQTLMHFSSVMLYQSKYGASKTESDPVEVQYGYLKTSDGMKLYSSANTHEGQKWLKDNSGGDQLMEHVKAAARQNDNPEVKRHALKLLSFPENQQARRDAIDKSDLTPDDKTKLKDDLEQSDKLHKEFFTGTHNVVQNSSGAMSQKELKVTNKQRNRAGNTQFESPYLGKKAEKMQRHAEQNIATQMHSDVSEGNNLAEIAGTKIRCGSCNSELGPSVKDGKEDFYVAGQMYRGQASDDGLKNTMGAEDDRGRPQYKFSSKAGGRSESTSPARLEGGNAYYQLKQERPPKASQPPVETSA